MGVNNGQAFQFPSRSRREGFFLVLAVALLCGASLFAAAPARKTNFDPRRDGFGFANDTVREYRPDGSGQIRGYRRDDAHTARFAHSCFLITRATLQFSRFVRFAPKLPKVSDAEYERRVRQLFGIPPWFPAKPHGIVIPGYRDLYEFSLAQKPMLEETIGSWLMTYFRPGNWRLMMPFPRAGQALAMRRLTAKLDQGQLQAVYLARFPHMNHCVTLYDYTRKPNGDVVFQLYDPNYPGEPAWLRYHADTRAFELEKRWYFNTGRVNLMRVYISPLH